MAYLLPDPLPVARFRYSLSDRCGNAFYRPKELRLISG
jgi:hypothetical protein